MCMSGKAVAEATCGHEYCLDCVKYLQFNVYEHGKCSRCNCCDKGLSAFARLPDAPGLHNDYLNGSVLWLIPEAVDVSFSADTRLDGFHTDRDEIKRKVAIKRCEAIDPEKDEARFASWELIKLFLPSDILGEPAMWLYEQKTIGDEYGELFEFLTSKFPKWLEEARSKYDEDELEAARVEASHQWTAAAKARSAAWDTRKPKLGNHAFSHDDVAAKLSALLGSKMTSADVAAALAKIRGQ